jgi:integrase/recombinase XerD
MSIDTHLSAPGAATTRPSDSIDEELRRYDEHLRDVHGLSPGTRRDYLRIAGRLLHQQGDHSVGIANLHPGDIRRFLADELDARKTPSHASAVAAGLRSYLRYRSTCGDAVGALTAVIASPAHWTLATLPKTLTEEEVAQLLGSFSEV